MTNSVQNRKIQQTKPIVTNGLWIAQILLILMVIQHNENGEQILIVMGHTQ